MAKVRARMDDDIIANMQSRVDRCRRLAKDCTDERVAETLRQMAEEGEADIARHRAERDVGQGPQLTVPDRPF
jgi:hypothetical protein